VNLFLSALYRLLKAIVVFTLRIFYPHTAFIDRHFLHHKGPAILIVNHPNTLLDALFGALSSPRYTFFLANYSLFKKPCGGLAAQSVVLHPHPTLSGHQWPPAAK